MENNIENKEMTAQQSLNLISEMMNNSRKSILSKNGKHFILWGALLTIVSFVIYELWHTTGNPNWNLLWLAMPIIGFPMVKIISKKDAEIPQNIISRQISGYPRHRLIPRPACFCHFSILLVKGTVLLTFFAPKNNARTEAYPRGTMFPSEQELRSAYERISFSSVLLTSTKPSPRI